MSEIIRTWKYAIIGIVFITMLTVSSLIIFNDEPNITGQSVYVKYYGISNYPLNSQANKVQTYVKLTQPDLGTLKVAGTAISVARSIAQAADYGNSIASLAQGSAPLPIPTSGLDVVISAAGIITQKFADDTQCLRTIGSRYGSQKEFEFVVVSEIKYQICPSYPDWFVAVISHSYYTKSGQYVCQQTGSKLFSMEMGTGKTSKSTYGC